MNHTILVQQLIEEYKISPVDILRLDDAQGEYNYLCRLQDTYCRTIRDLEQVFSGELSGKTVLEIGAFLGVVSIALKRMGATVYALDLDEFYQSPSLRALYARNEIPFVGLNLRDAELPYATASLDAVVICEVIEHFNFNPLPVLQEINRVLKPGGLIYIGMPNQVRLGNRLRLLLGRSIHNPIQDFFAQLDRRSNLIVGLHWREYTLDETVQPGFSLRAIQTISGCDWQKN